MEHTSDSLLPCYLNASHFVCREPVKLPCMTIGNEIRFACYDCIVSHINHTDIFECKVCNNEHRLNLITKSFDIIPLSQHQANLTENKNVNCKIQKTSTDLIELTARSIQKLQGKLMKI